MPIAIQTEKLIFLVCEKCGGPLSTYLLDYVMLFTYSYLEIYFGTKRVLYPQKMQQKQCTKGFQTTLLFVI
jgi:hypothetical protein